MNRAGVLKARGASDGETPPDICAGDYSHMPSFIQISDPHIVTDGAMVCGHSDTASALKRAIATINEMLPRLNNVDCAIVTGDLTDHGTPEEYAHFTQLMAALQLPWMAVPGNHDRRDAMRAAFEGRDWMTARGPVQWHRDFGAFSVIGLDTLVDGAHHGCLCAQGLDFVDATLRAIGDQPAVIATHHPWIASGVPAIDADNLRNGDVLLERLAAHSGPVAAGQRGRPASRRCSSGTSSSGMTSSSAATAVNEAFSPNSCDSPPIIGGPTKNPA